MHPSSRLTESRKGNGGKIPEPDSGILQLFPKSTTQPVGSESIHNQTHVNAAVNCSLQFFKNSFTCAVNFKDIYLDMQDPAGRTNECRQLLKISRATSDDPHRMTRNEIIYGQLLVLYSYKFNLNGAPSGKGNNSNQSEIVKYTETQVRQKLIIHGNTPF